MSILLSPVAAHVVRQDGKHFGMFDTSLAMKKNFAFTVKQFQRVPAKSLL